MSWGEYDYHSAHDEDGVSPTHNKLSEPAKKVLKLSKLGFDPTLYVNLAGVVAGGKDRQEVLRLASAFVTASSTLTQTNDGIRFYRDHKNEYDRFAIQVWFATRREGGRFTQHKIAGFIPRRLCTNCWKSFGGKSSEALQCPYCHGPLNLQPMSWINRFLCEKYFDVGKNIWYSVWWINQKNPSSSWGCQLALGLPPIELIPPRS